MTTHQKNAVLELIEVDKQIKALQERRGLLEKVAREAVLYKGGSLRFIVDGGKTLATVSGANDGSASVFTHIERIDLV